MRDYYIFDPPGDWAYRQRTRAASGNDVRDLRCEERKVGKIRPVGTISREGMRYPRYYYAVDCLENHLL